MSTFQFQIFSHRTKRGAYIVEASGNDPDTLRERATLWRRWRIVRTAKARSLEPRYVVPRSRASDYTREDVVQRYLEWARARGLAHVHAYPGLAAALARAAGFTVSHVDPAEHLGPAPAPELDTLEDEAA